RRVLFRSFSSDYIGFFEIFLGTYVTGSNTGGVNVDLFNGATLVQSQYVRGNVQRVLLNHGKGNFTVKITLASSISTAIRISQMYWWKKREISPQSIFKPSDVVLFLTDSWGVYPEENNAEFKVPQFDGHLINGRCYMPTEFKKWFVLNGGVASNVHLACRGGMTTVWGKYWLP